MQFIINSLEETEKFCFDLADKLNPGDVLAFYGDLGSGKTQMIKSIGRCFHVEEMISSPTFVIHNQYRGKIKGANFILNHFDFYRVENDQIEKTWNEFGLNDFLWNKDCICFIEWAERIESRLNQDHWKLKIIKTGEEHRKIEYEYLRY